ncbi:unnamed protein product [Prunus brigantina]
MVATNPNEIPTKYDRESELQAFDDTKVGIRTWGFFQIANHGVPVDLLEELKGGVHGFFEQDTDVKKQFYTREYFQPLIQECRAQGSGKPCRSKNIGDKLLYDRMSFISSSYFKLELQFEDRAVQFVVAPVHAAIIMQFQNQTRQTSKNLAAAIGIPTEILNRRINFWISKGILAESFGADSEDQVFTLMEGMVDSGESSVASVEDQLHKEMTVYKFILGMLTNFGSMALDRTHNTLKMFCIADPPYDKTLQQLQSF